MNQKICRLCLQTIGESCQVIRETLKHILKLNLGISKDTVMCVSCRNNLQVFFDLKSDCADVRERALSLTDVKNSVNLDPVKVEISNLKLFTEITCNFCTKPTGKESLTSLHESNENMFLVNILEKYIPELNLTNIEGLLTCETCLDRIQFVSSFLKKCLDVEDKINKYIEIEGKDDKGQIELQNVQQFIFKSTLKFEAESCYENEVNPTYDHVQEEFPLKVDNIESLIKTEDVDIKSEQSDCDSFRYQEPSANIKLDNNHKNSLNVTVYNCDTCTYETTHRRHFYQHKRLHKFRIMKKNFNCELCEYKGKYRYIINKHMLTHKSALEVTMFKCSKCDYESKYKQHLKPHMLIHKSPLEITMFKCEMCTYEAKYESNLKRHMLIHKKPLEVTMYKCGTCAYETRHMGRFSQHKVLHERRTQMKMFKCEMCEFEAEHESKLKRHMSIHKKPSKIPMFKCDKCTYKTTHRSHFNQHKLLHKSHTEIEMFKCAMCTYETKYESNLKRHTSIHKNTKGTPSKVTMYKCDTCTYETKHSGHFNYHTLLHKSRMEVKMFK